MDKLGEYHFVDDGAKQTQLRLEAEAKREDDAIRRFGRVVYRALGPHAPHRLKTHEAWRDLARALTDILEVELIW